MASTSASVFSKIWPAFFALSNGAHATQRENRRGGCMMEAVEVRPRSSDGNEVDANLRVDVRKLQDNKMWIGNRNASSPSSHSDDSYDPSKRRRNKKPPISSSSDRQKSRWNDAEMKRKCRLASYELYSSRGSLKSSLQAAFRFFKP